ncbi:MAG: hypothetical protein ABI955_04255 [Nitrospirota bacterium]
MPVAARTGWVSPHEPLTLTRQCALTGVTRSTIYAPHPVATPDEQELILLGLIDAEYTRHPFYGSPARFGSTCVGSGTRSIASGCND